MTARKPRFYIGTYTHRDSEGVYLLELDPDAGRLSPPRLAGKAENPSFVTLHPNGRFLYAANETGTFDGRESGAVTAFAVDADTGALKDINQQASGGTAPCYVSVDAAGKVAMAANYGGGSVAALKIRNDGGLDEALVVPHRGSGPDPKRQRAPHAHQILPAPGNCFAVAADLGMDKVIVYRLDAELGALEPQGDPVQVGPAGAGPRHVAFGADGRFVYVVNEMGGSVTTCAWDGEAGELRAIETVSTLPEGYTGKKSCAEVRVHPSGRFVYASNRGHDSIAVFEVDEQTGRLQARGQIHTGGKEPRNFALDAQGRWLLAAHQESDEVVLLAVDEASGKLEETGERVDVSMPVCVRSA